MKEGSSSQKFARGEGDHPETGEVSDNKAFSKAAPAGAVLIQCGVEFTVTVLAGAAGGFFLGTWIGLKPLLMVLGLLVGALAGGWRLIKATRALAGGKSNDKVK